MTSLEIELFFYQDNLELELYPYKINDLLTATFLVNFIPKVAFKRELKRDIYFKIYQNKHCFIILCLEIDNQKLKLKVLEYFS